MSRLKRALRTFNSASLSSSYQSIGNVIPFTTSKVAILNLSNVDVLITDGSDQEDLRVPATSTLNIGEGLSSYGQMRSTGYVFDANTQLKIKQATAAGIGNIIINLLGI